MPPFVLALSMGLAHSLLLALAFPPVSFGVLGLLAPLPLLLLVWRADRPWRTGLAVTLGALPFYGYHHLWVFAVSGAGAPPLILIQSIWPGLFVALSILTIRRLPLRARFAALAVLWTGMEFFRGRIFFDGYPWFLTAHPTVDLPLAGWASVIGVYGLGLLIVLLLCSFVAAAFSENRDLRRWAIPAVCFAVLAFGAFLRPSAGAERTVTIAVVQTNLPQSNKMFWTQSERIQAFREWEMLTIRAAGASPQPDLIIWPETMFPGPTLSPQAIAEYADLESRLGFSSNEHSFGTLFVHPLLETQHSLGVPMLIGAIGYENFRATIDAAGEINLDSDATFNSTFLIVDGAIQPERYDKIFLTPFGETMPYISHFPRLEQAMLDFAARGMSFDLDSGDRKVRFQIQPATGGPAVRIATPICFEATIPYVCRRLVFGPGAERQADVLVNMTNDGWFGSFDPGRRNHLLISRWRAIELGTPVVRAANTGISCVVDASGRVVSSLSARRPAAVLTTEVPLPSGSRTIYARIGDLVGWLAFAASLGLLSLAFLHRRTPMSKETSTP